MLKTIDHIQLATPNARETAVGWQKFIGAEFLDEGRVNALGAKRIRFRIGTSVVEFLEPDGPGPVEKAIKSRGRAHLFAAGITSDKFDDVIDRLEKKGVNAVVDQGQAFFDASDFIGAQGRMVLSSYEERPAVGNAEYFYEATLLTEDTSGVVSRIADLFGLDQGNFVPIDSEHFEYGGTLTLFDSNELHRFEVIEPFPGKQTMRRYFERTGSCYYMAFVQSDVLLTIEREVSASGLGVTINRPEDRSGDISPDELWVHPPALGGMMLGMSRPSMAWRWSGYPERVRQL
ncbi:MAG TPA: hypothetical protein EYN96_03510 [Candidatus Hydrogenedentes bacterium]|nr:hypothetical protein [Candidatus Hydrogenedentota bacterium]HIB54977.1 hypothetical protein [Nitrospirales bacterium]HIO22431.1 hypothetical protein [Nitrospirales bacterium]